LPGVGWFSRQRPKREGARERAGVGRRSQESTGLFIRSEAARRSARKKPFLRADCFSAVAGDKVSRGRRGFISPGQEAVENRGKKHRRPKPLAGEGLLRAGRFFEKMTSPVERNARATLNNRWGRRIRLVIQTRVRRPFVRPHRPTPGSAIHAVPFAGCCQSRDAGAPWPLASVPRAWQVIPPAWSAATPFLPGWHFSYRVPCSPPGVCLPPTALAAPGVGFRQQERPLIRHGMALASGGESLW
jgi:hypothetical protein